MSNAARGLSEQNSVSTKKAKQGVKEKTGFVWQEEMKMHDISKEEE